MSLTNSRIKSSVAVVALVAATGLTTHAGIVDLSYSANSFGLNPTISLDQGSAAGVADGSLFDWGSGTPSSPRNFTATTMSPYMTWATPQTVSSVRVWGDVAVAYDSVSVSVLNTGGAPTNLSDWTQVYTSGTGLNKGYIDVSLGGTFTTSGLRVIATKTTSDINVGEVAAFGPQLRSGTLTDNRVMPISASASSTDFGRTPSLGIDGVWTSSFLSQVASSDPDASTSGFFHYDVSYNNATIDALEYSWGDQPGFGGVPSQWTVQYQQTGGGGFITIGTFNEVIVGGIPRIMYYLDLDSITGGIENVQTIRLLVNAADEPNNRLSVAEFEAFAVPEPTSLGLLTIGGATALKRRRRARIENGLISVAVVN